MPILHTQRWLRGWEEIKAGNFQYLKTPVFTVGEPVENLVKEK